MWTYALNSDRTRYNPSQVSGKEAVAEWLRAAMHTTQGEQMHLPPKFGIDVVRILSGDSPEYYLRQSLEDTCDLRDDVELDDCTIRMDGRDMYVSAQFRTIYGDIDIPEIRIITR